MTLYTDRVDEPSFPGARIRPIDVPGTRFGIWERLVLPGAAWVDRLSLLHCPAQTAPPLAPCPVVLTVHDLIPLRVDEGWSKRSVRQFRRALLRAVRQARRIIAVSESTKRDLLATVPVPEFKIDVVPWGVDLPETAADADDADAWETTRRALGIRGPYFLGFGGDSPRKNVRGMLAALGLFTQTVSPDVQLLLVGVPPRSRPTTLREADVHGVSNHLLLGDYLSNDALAQLLRRCEAVVYPSLYEGFGLPILEAMAHGTPVITSNVSSMPEVAGDAALLIDPRRPDAIASAMRDCYRDAALKTALRERGRLRASRFTWSATVAATLACYQRAVEVHAV